MDYWNLTEPVVNTGLSFPLPALRLFIPPLRLFSAAMWQVAQRGDIMDYGKLEEFVTFVTETVPELLSFRQRTQLIVGLRAKLSPAGCLISVTSTWEKGERPLGTLIEGVGDPGEPGGHCLSGPGERGGREGGRVGSGGRRDRNGRKEDRKE
ncbi:unnamed protein product [Coregonus sp. 'balchen']|nr:unnamed protein product [Coregonus sp. 'balchen']